MNDPYEFTPKELYQISLYKQPAALWSMTFNRTLWFLVPSVALAVYSFVSESQDYIFFAFGILLFQTVYRMTVAKRALQTMHSIITKYEGKLQRNQPGG